MSEAKLELNLGALPFSGQGEQGWLAEQLDKVLAAGPDLARLQPAAPTPAAGGNGAGNGAAEENFTTTLASYVKEKGAESSQVQRFLATADWLRRRGRKELTTSAVSKALSDHQQKRLANPADCLNKNVGKGYCEKRGNGFFITPEGLKHLGHK